ncbi:MAG: helix-turn-helix domain-containing protein, partial [Acidobacteria bacterium]
MPEHPPQDFGAYLREARLSQGISLRQIAARTKISLQALEALERNDVQRLPGGIFTRAFVRAYAREVGLDPERMVRFFVARFEAQAEDATGGGRRQEEDLPEGARDGRRANLVALAGLAVMATAIVVYFLLGRGPATPRPPEPEPPPAVETSPAPRAESTTGGSVDTPQPQDLPPPSTEPGPAIVKPPAALSLALTASGDCWVSATIDGTRTYQKLLRADDHVEIEADRAIVLRVGDAGAITFTLNGEPGRPL